MIKRLSISLLLMGLAAFGLGAAAFAWFSDSGQGEVSITAGDADIRFRVDFDCDNATGVWDTGYFQADTSPFAFDWTGIVPGDTTADCIEVNNSGDGELTVYVGHGTFTGSSSLRDATLWQYNVAGTGAINCLPTDPDDSQYTTGRGCLLDSIDSGESFTVRVDVEFEDTGGPQNGLQEQSFGFLSTLTGYTG